MHLGLDATKLYLSLGSPPKRDSNQSTQLQRLVKKWNFACSKCRYDIFQKFNNKCVDQAAQMRKLVCAFVVRKLRRQISSCRGPFVLALMVFRSRTWDFSTYHIYMQWRLNQAYESANSPEHSLLTIYRCRWNSDQTSDPLVPVYLWLGAYTGGIYAYAVSTKISDREAQWLSGSVLDLTSRCHWFESYQKHCVVSLNMARYTLHSTYAWI